MDICGLSENELVQKLQLGVTVQVLPAQWHLPTHLLPVDYIVFEQYKVRAPSAIDGTAVNNAADNHALIALRMSENTSLCVSRSVVCSAR